jgi:hypothetical protein
MEQGKAWAPPAVIHLTTTTAGVYVALAQWPREVGYLPNDKPLYKFTNMRVDTIHDMTEALVLQCCAAYPGRPAKPNQAVESVKLSAAGTLTVRSLKGTTRVSSSRNVIVRPCAHHLQYNANTRGR